MSRDVTIDPGREPAARPTGGGPEMPRGGRSGGAARPQPRPADDVRDALTQQLRLPRGPEREPVRVGGRTVPLRGSEVRTLALVGAFRVVDGRDLGADPSRGGDRWHGDLEHLRRQGLIALTPQLLDGQRTALVTLTGTGRALLDQHQQTGPGQARQAFYAGLVKPREATHDAQLARVYAEAAHRLQGAGGRIVRVVVDYELKRDYQRFLHERDHAGAARSGRPARSAAEIRAWADEHRLPIVEGRVQFPDVRVEYEHADGRRDREDLELATGHYSSRQMAAKQASGFQIHHSGASQLRAGRVRRGGSPFDPQTAAQVLR